MSIHIPSAAIIMFLICASPVYANDQNNNAYIDLPVSITWEDQNNLYSSRPEKVTLMLTKNGTDLQEIELSSQNNWNAELKNMPVFSPEASEITSVSSDSAARWTLESPDNTDTLWLQYTSDPEWVTSEYAASSSTSDSGILQIINSSEEYYLVFFKDEDGNLLSDQNGSITQQCAPGETDFTVPDEASSFCVSYLASDSYFTVQKIIPDELIPVDYTVYPTDTVPCYIPTVDGTDVTYTMNELSIGLNATDRLSFSDEFEIDVSLNSSDNVVEDVTKLTSMNNWTAEVHIARSTPLIYFSGSTEKDTPTGFSGTGYTFSVLGDSFSEVSDPTSDDDPEGYSLNSKWWQQVASIFGVRLLSNQACGGSGVNVSTTEDISNTAFDRIPLLCSEKSLPDDILILIGINDLIRGDSPEVLSDNYDRLLDELQSAYPCSNLILFTYPQVYGYFSTTIRQCNHIIRLAAAKHGLVLIDLEDWNVSEQEVTSYLRTDDTLHPNRKGQLLMGEIAAEQLRELSVTEYTFSAHTTGDYSTSVKYEAGNCRITITTDETNIISENKFNYHILLIICAGILSIIILCVYHLKKQKKYL